MRKNFAKFIERLHHHPACFQEYHLDTLLESKDIKALKDSCFLKRGSDLKEILCKSCDNDHFLPVKVENEQAYYLCPYEDTSRNPLELEEITTWQFNVEAFLQELCLKLEVQSNIEKMVVQGLWQVGSFTKDDTRHNCYFYHGKQFDEALAFIKQLPSNNRRYVIFTSKQETSTLESEHDLRLVEMKDLVIIKNTKLVFDGKFFNEFLINAFRNVIFSKKNGDLIVNGQTIANVTPSTAEYNFVELLWENFNEPVSHQRIKGHIYKKTSKEYEDDPQKLSHKQKNKVKKESSAPSLIDEIFKTTKDFDGNNAYIMRNPV